LALKAGVPRPNLSDIERGEREVSLRTLRALALALGIPAGVLADGVGPDLGMREEPLSRERLERIAEAVAAGQTPADPMDRALAEKAETVSGSLLRAHGNRRGRQRMAVRKAERAWLSLNGSAASPEIQSLLGRIAEKTASKAELPPSSPRERKKVPPLKRRSGKPEGLKA